MTDLKTLNTVAGLQEHAAHCAWMAVGYTGSLVRSGDTDPARVRCAAAWQRLADRAAWEAQWLLRKLLNSGG